MRDTSTHRFYTKREIETERERLRQCPGSIAELNFLDAIRTGCRDCKLFDVECLLGKTIDVATMSDGCDHWHWNGEPY